MVDMKVSVIKKDENPLLKRSEVRFEVDHEGGPTPKRLDVRKELAGQLGVPEDMVVIEKFATMYGRQVASGIARAYDSKERLEELEPKYLLERGLPKEEKAEEKPPEKPPEKEEKPKEEKPPKKPEEKPKEEKPPEEKKPEEKPPEKEGKPKEKPEEKPKEGPEEKAKPEVKEEPEEVKEKPPEKPKEEEESGEKGEEKA